MNHFHRFLLQIITLSVTITSAEAGVIPFFNPSLSKKYENSFSLKANTFLTNDPFTLKDLLLNGLKGEEHAKSGDNIALGVARFDAGYGDEKYGYIGYTYREEIFIKASKDAVDLVYQATNKLDLPVGRYYDLYFQIKAYEMQGIVYANKIDISVKNGWSVKIGAACEALYAKKMQDGYISGNAVANSSKDYSFYGISNYNYTHNYLYDLNVNPSTAYGYSTHFSIDINKGNFHLSFMGNDIFAKLYWDALPYSDVYLSSNNKVYDENGYVKYKPLLSGKEGYSKYTQKLMAKYRLESDYFYDGVWNLKVGSDYMEGIYLPYVACAYHFNKDANVALGYESRFKSFSIASRYKSFTLGLRTDDLFEPSTLGLSVGMSF